ncbi:hybrid sensor histidine kinase/response regulator [Altererythrobacter lauratis]|uniref:histidine kinase n=1 Tax=Alteraurantiacibacter lauratis TaxID=2054627 RepID=A0ABV7EHL5_9SPHN
MLTTDRAAALALSLILLATLVEAALLASDIATGGDHRPFHIVTLVVLLVILLCGLASFAFLRRRIAALLDLSARLEAALRARQAAEAANRAKVRYLANVSHEIRSPLNAIYGYAQLLESQGDVDPVQAARVIRRCTEHITSLTESLLDITQLENGMLRLRHEPVNLPDFLDQIGWMMRPAAQAKGIGFAIEVGSRLPETVRTDPGRLRQALLNIIGNAIKYTDSGSVTLKMTYRGQIATFEIRDTGPGISPEDQLRIFDPYEQVGELSGSMLESGVGLGLPITKAIIEIMGGKLELESAPGRGSVFRITLMLAEPANALVPDVTNRRITGYQGPRRKVLVVDDEADQRAMLKQFLGECGFDVVTAPNGEAAIAEVQAGAFDLVLLDITMPGLSGWETAARIREMAGRQVQICMASGNVQEFHRPQTDKPTHDHFFIKPYRLSELAETIGALMGLSWKWESTGPESEEAAGQRSGGLPRKAMPHVERLRELVQIGHVRGIETEIGLLATAAPQHGKLVTALYAALDQFDLAGLLRLLEEA